MRKQIKIPELGESINEATISQWLKNNKDYVIKDEIILVLETDKASVEVVAEFSGNLTILSPAGAKVPVGSLVGEIDTSAVQPVKQSLPEKISLEAAPIPPSKQIVADELKLSLSPAVRKIVAEKNLDPNHLTGSGKDGRLTKADVIAAQAPDPTQPVISKQADIRRVPMTTIRKRTAERLVEAQHTAAILTTFNEIDMSVVMNLKNKFGKAFEDKHGVKLGFMGFFVKACTEALKVYPGVNASLEGDDIIYKNFYNIGIAVNTEKGLVVPVIKDADELTLAGIETAIRQYATKAREGRLTIENLSHGTFTITNGGVFGSLLSTPILNPPQSGILGMHKIEDRPVAINGKVEIRPMMYVALSYDHRLVDGAQSVGFLVRVKEHVENAGLTLLDI